MKIKVASKDIDHVLSLPKEKHLKPKRPNIFFRYLLKLLSSFELSKVNFTRRDIGMERLGRNEPCLVLMNHSGFIDLKIAMTVLYPRPVNIVCTTDGFVGKRGLMRAIGCIPAKKFVTDFSLVKDTVYAVRELGDSVLMYPEASYSFDGTATPLPEHIGKFVKSLGIPIVMIRTYGAFARDPLYNNLQLRNVRVSADVEYLLSADEIKNMSAEAVCDVINSRFEFDNFKWQKDNKVRISESFRADFLNRVLYKCPSCGIEGQMRGAGVSLVCGACGKKYTLGEYGEMESEKGVCEFPHIPDWYRFERDAVRAEILDGSYYLRVPVDIFMMVNTKKIYKVGSGILTHSAKGFELKGCDGRLSYSQKPLASYSLYADYNWYELGDIICIGSGDVFYYCMPTNSSDVVAKTRLAAEELYKIEKEKKRGTLASVSR